MDEGYLRQSALIRVGRALASLKLTLVVLVALGAGVLAAYLSETRTTWMLVGPLALFALNLSKHEWVFYTAKYRIQVE